MSYVLLLQEPEKGEREIPLSEGETSLGRDPSNNIILTGRGVSRRHAKLLRVGDRLMIVDLGSTYGTRVNNVVTLRQELLDGDEIIIGCYNLRIQHHADVPLARPSSGTSLPASQAEPYAVDVATQAPVSDVHLRKTVQMNRQAVQFILDNPDNSGNAVHVLVQKDSDLMRAMDHLGSLSTLSMPVVNQPQLANQTNYQALMLMYKVSELLAAAADFNGFVEPLAELVLNEIRADTVVLLMAGEEGELLPQVIRHRGNLHAGEIPISRGIIDRVMQEKAAVMSNDVSHDHRLTSGQSIVLYQIRAVVALPLVVHGKLSGVLYLSRSGPPGFTSNESELVAALAHLVSSGIEQAELKERATQEKQWRKALERFHPPEVVDWLFTHEVGESYLKEQNATALVCNLHGFSQLVENVSPPQLSDILQEYYDLLYEKIFCNGGSLVKLHDGWSLALFGTVNSPDKDAVWAVEAAKQLCSDFNSLKSFWREVPQVALTCALDKGMLVAGVIGSAERMEYTAFGSPISNASQLVNASSETAILLTERTWAELPQAHYQVQETTGLANLRIYRLANILEGDK